METKNIIIAEFNAKREMFIKAIHSYNEGFTTDSALWLKSMMEWMVSENGCKAWAKSQDMYDLMTEASEAVGVLMNPKSMAIAAQNSKIEEDQYYRNRANSNASIKTYSNY
jgi:hypothetical protein